MKRELTTQEQLWVEAAYPLISFIMRKYNLSKNDIEDWHGNLSVALCEAIMLFDIECSRFYQEIETNEIVVLDDKELLNKWLHFAYCQLQDYTHSILESKQYQIKEIPSGLRPHCAAGRRM